jgi:hypothetical protein
VSSSKRWLPWFNISYRKPTKSKGWYKLKKSISDSLGHHTSNAEVSSEAVELLLPYKLFIINFFAFQQGK